MCGISGFYLKEPNDDLFKNLSSSLKNLNHRGPDDNGIVYSDSKKVAFGHTRLSIIDLSSAGHQPMVSSNSHTFLSYNGEIYNHKDLKEKFLNDDSIEWKGTSDSEVLINLLNYYSENSLPITSLLNKLNGIFAFAYWDNKKDELIIARDSFGVKPIYYFNSKRGFYFASEIKGLLPLIINKDKEELIKNKDQNHLLDLNSINRYLTYLWCPGQGTPFSFIKKVNPGEYIKINKDHEVTFHNWYDIISLSSSINNLSLEENIKQTRYLLRQAVHRQMLSDVPVGAFLSGGLDSSSIVNFAREIDKNIQCFTIDGSKYNDNEGILGDIDYAKQVSKYLNVPLEIVEIDHAKLARGFENMISQLDEPLADPAPLNVFWISEIASQLGIKVLLSGAGGDDLFTGYRRHLALNLEKYWEWLPKNIKLKLEKGTATLPISNPFFRRLSKLFSAASLSKEERLINYFRWTKRKDLEKLYSKKFRKLINFQEIDAPIREFVLRMPEDMHSLTKMLCLEQRFFLSDHNLIYTDKMSMALGIETRVPFLDPDLVSFSRSIPLKWKQKGRVGKWILKKVMEPYLPQNVIYRPKSGFGAPIRYLLKNDLRDWLFEILSKERLSSRGIFDHNAVHDLILKSESGQIDASYTILSLLSIELWCSSYLSLKI